MTLKQIWCGVTTGHNFYAEELLNSFDVIVVGHCKRCQKTVMCIADIPFQQVRKWAVIKVGPKPECVVRNVLGPIPVETQRFDDKTLPPGKWIMHGGTLMGIVTPETTDHPNKAHAATRKRGPNGQFLPHIGLPTRKVKAWRKRIRKKPVRAGKKK